MDNSSLANRMKEYYEKIPQTKLMRRVPVAIRIDGKAFHTFTRGFDKPFDKVLMTAMQETMKYLCENIQNCVFGYSQSDEVTLILIDYQTLENDAWFGYEVQKLCSISASMATMAFNKYFDELATDYFCYPMDSDDIKVLDLAEAYSKAISKGAMFDARCFNIPKEEVCNLIYWRQLDATRNSIQSVGQANFSHAELQGKSCNDIQTMLIEQKNINWSDFPTACKRGSACIKSPVKPVIDFVTGDTHYELDWVIDREMPILKGEGRNYVERFIMI